MTPYFSFRYRAVIYALAADDIILQMKVDIMCTTPLSIIGWPRFGIFINNNYMPDLMRTVDFKNRVAFIVPDDCVQIRSTII